MKISVYSSTPRSGENNYSRGYEVSRHERTSIGARRAECGGEVLRVGQLAPTLQVEDFGKRCKPPSPSSMTCGEAPAEIEFGAF